MNLDEYSYRTITSLGEGVYRDRGSKFISYVSPQDNAGGIEEFLSVISSKHPKSRHVCYAYRLGREGEEYRFNDDGEPSGSAGRPIYNELLSREVTNVVCAVVRYFGGTKLGIPGLIAAYRGAAKLAFDQVNIITIHPSCRYRITYKIEDMGKIYDVLKSSGIEIVESVFDPSPSIIINVLLSQEADLPKKVTAAFHGYSIADLHQDFVSDRLLIEKISMSI